MPLAFGILRLVLFTFHSFHFMKKHLVLFTLVATLFVSGCSLFGNDSGGSVPSPSVADSGRIAAVDGVDHDWGDINIMAGEVSKVFTLMNDGEKDLVLMGVQTSCMCTKAVVVLPDGQKSPEFGMHVNPSWSAAIAPGGRFDVDVVFDPLAHGPTATGPISRIVYVLSSSTADSSFVKMTPQGSMTELHLKGNVLSDADFKKSL